jgi:F-type H+-transporting ATPase subunit b
MRSTLLRSLSLLAISATPLAAAPGAPAEGGKVNLLDPHSGLMIWTLLIFLVLLVVLSKFAFKPLIAAVAAREQALEEAIEGARRDREEAARLLADQRLQLEAARGEAQRFIADGRATAAQKRADLLEQTRVQQQELLDRARRDIEGERDKAIAALRREAIDLAIAGASKVVEQNLDDAGNRRLVETFLGSLSTAGAASSRPARG